MLPEFQEYFTLHHGTRHPTGVGWLPACRVASLSDPRIMQRHGPIPENRTLHTDFDLGQ